MSETNLGMTGGIMEVPRNDNKLWLEIESLASYAVDDYNKKKNAVLEFVKVVNAKEQVVAGVLYYITLEAIDGGQKKVYETKVWVKTWENFKGVREFKLIGDVPSGSTTTTTTTSA